MWLGVYWRYPFPGGISNLDAAIFFAGEPEIGIYVHLKLQIVIVGTVSDVTFSFPPDPTAFLFAFSTIFARPRIFRPPSSPAFLFHPAQSSSISPFAAPQIPTTSFLVSTDFAHPQFCSLFASSGFARPAFPHFFRFRPQSLFRLSFLPISPILPFPILPVRSVLCLRCSYLAETSACVMLNAKFFHISGSDNRSVSRFSDVLRYYLGVTKSARFAIRLIWYGPPHDFSAPSWPTGEVRWGISPPYNGISSDSLAISANGGFPN